LLISGHLVYLNHLAEADDYPKDMFLEFENNKKALIIVAHDDDAIRMVRHDIIFM